MIESLTVLYLLVGFMFSCAVWKEYDKDTSAAKDAIPKWIFALSITLVCLVWPIMLIRYLIVKQRRSGMSEMELNKGKLIPFEMTEDVAKQLVESVGEDLDTSRYKTYLDQVKDDYTWYDEDLCRINDKWYKPIFEVRRGELDFFAEAIENEDGTIDFHTYHYNGGAHWTEVVEGALEK